MLFITRSAEGKVVIRDDGLVMDQFDSLKEAEEALLSYAENAVRNEAELRRDLESVLQWQDEIQDGLNQTRSLIEAEDTPSPFNSRS